MPRPELSTLRYPNLWQGCVGAWCPSQSGATGYRLFDDSGNNNHGTLTNFALSGNTSNWLVDGLHFDGSNDFIAFSNALTTDYLNRSHSFSFWGKHGSVTQNYPGVIVHGSNSSPVAGSSFLLGLSSDPNVGNRIYFSYTDGTNGNAAYSPYTTADFVQRHYVGIVNRQSQLISLYINGILVDARSIANVGNVSVSRSLEIGKRVFGTIDIYSAILGLDDIRIYNRVLQPNEIRQLASSRGIAYASKSRMKRAYVPGYRITAPSRIQTGSARTIDGTDTESLSRGLIGAWCPSLGASGYRLLDRSGNNNHGVLTGMDPGTDWVPSGGKLALDFDGVNDCIEIPNREYLQSLQVPMTISAWCYKSSGSIGPVFTQYQNITGSSLVKLAGYSTTEFSYYASTAAGGYQRVAYSTVPSLNQWHFLTWVVSGSIASPTCRLGQNGVEESFSLSALSSSPNTSVPHRIGCTFYNGANAEFNKITLDDVRIYNRALTPSEIRLLYTGGRGVGLLPEAKPKRARIVAWDNQDKISVPARVLTNTDSLKRGLVGHWSPSVSGPQGNRLMDLSGQNNHGTLQNMDYQTDYVPSAEKGGRMALDFDGSNDYVTTNLSCVGFTSLDYSAWIYRASSSENCYLGPSKGGNYGPRANLALFGTTTYLAAEDTTNAIYGQVSNSRTGWNHFHYSFSGNAGSSPDRLKLWINGVEQSLTYSGTVPSFLGDVGVFELGRAVGTGSYGTGQMDDVRVWKRRLTPQEIRLLAQSRMPERATPQRTRTVFYSSGLISYLRRRSYNSILGSGVLS